MARRRGQLLDGVLLLDKPAGLSSNQALQKARRLLNARKAGHTGTLDPFATGLLVCCFGRATKIAGRMLDADKRYEATLRFGSETDTGDFTGEVINTAPNGFAGIQRAELDRVLPSFRGASQQVPPMYSALKHKGKPLYEYARRGVTIERPPRDIEIYRLEVLAFDGLSAQIDVHSSKGTYIRTLAQDIGQAIGCGAHLTALRRTEVGPFLLANAISFDELSSLEDPKTSLLSLDNLPAGLDPARSNS